MNSLMEKHIRDIYRHYSNVPFSWERYAKNLDEERRRRKKDSSQIEEEPEYFSLESDEIPDGRFYTEIGSAHIEGFLKRGSGELLYVFFDGARTRNQGRDLAPVPNFSRWSWYMYTEGSVLSLEDPMYYRYDQCKLGWFYGTQEEDYRKYCAQCIERIASLLKIAGNNIVLYGSSGGGTAAIGVSAHLPGCMTVAINPQLALEKYEYSAEFEKVTGIPILHVPDLYKRNVPCALIKENSAGHYLIAVNVRSKADFTEHLRALCEEIDMEPGYGICVKGNVCIWLYNAPGAPSEHTSLETTAMFSAFEFLIRCLRDGVDVSVLEGLYRLYNEFLYDHYQQLRKIKKPTDNPKLREISEELERMKAENKKLKQQLEELQTESLKGKITKWLRG